MVEDVEGVGAKLEPVVVLPHGIFLQTHVPILPGRSSEHVISGVPISSVGGRPTRAVDCATGAVHKHVVTGRSGKRCWIEPLGTGLLSRIQVDSWHYIGAPAYKTDGATRSGIGDREGLAGLE